MFKIYCYIYSIELIFFDICLYTFDNKIDINLRGMVTRIKKHSLNENYLLIHECNLDSDDRLVVDILKIVIFSFFI